MKKQIISILKRTFLPILFLFLFLINSLFLFPFNLYLKRKRKYFFIFNGLGVGDALSFTSAIKYLHKKERANFVVVSFYPEVFEGLKGVSNNIKISSWNRAFFYFLESSVHSNIISCYGGNIYYKRFSFLYKTEYGYYAKVLRSYRLYLMHVFLFARQDFLKKIKGANTRTSISFTLDEIKRYENKFRDVINGEYSITSSGISPFIRSKNIGIRKVNEVVGKTSGKTRWVQVGGEKEPFLKNVDLDLRGKTSLREMFFLVSRCKAVFTNEGILTHVSAAFDIPCISIYTGYHYPEISFYPNVSVVVPSPLPNCAYCFRKTCPISKNSNVGKCSKDIRVKDILEKVESIL